jgi:hypothetical protein
MKSLAGAAAVVVVVAVAATVFTSTSFIFALCGVVIPLVSRQEKRTAKEF